MSTSDDLTPVEELELWLRSEPDVRMMIVAFMQTTDATSIRDLHDRNFDAFASLYDVCAELLAQTPHAKDKRYGG